MRNHERPHFLSIPLAFALAAVGCKSSDASTDAPPDLTRASIADLKTGKQLYEATCTACHTIGKGDGVGPDLHGVHTRRDTSWLMQWMRDPVGMSKNDPAGRELLAKYNNVPMPPPGLDDEGIRKVLAYVVSVSKKTPASKTSPLTQGAPPAGAKGDNERAEVGREGPTGP